MLVGSNELGRIAGIFSPSAITTRGNATFKLISVTFCSTSWRFRSGPTVASLSMYCREKYCALCGCLFSLPKLRNPENPDPDEDPLLVYSDPYDSRVLPRELTEVYKILPTEE